MIQRQTFNILTDTGGDYTDTGGPVFGTVEQIRFAGGNVDTGCDVRLEFIASGVVVADYDNSGGGTWTRAPTIIPYDTGGAAVSGIATFPMTDHDRMRVTVNQSDGVTGSKTATLHVWLRS
ncbi:MAG TPA: hypothetical protein VGF29_15345 [Hyphomicrobiaceae bacterium]|jgi:hypothetical protein